MESYNIRTNQGNNSIGDENSDFIIDVDRHIIFKCLNTALCFTPKITYHCNFFRFNINFIITLKRLKKKKIRKYIDVGKTNCLVMRNLWKIRLKNLNK